MRNLRAALCEMFIGWSLRICPKDYCPSYVEAVVTAYQNGTDQKPLNNKRPATPEREIAS